MSIDQDLGIKIQDSKKKSVYESIEQLLNLTKNLNSLTELTANEARLITILEFMAKRYNSKDLSSFIVTFKINKVPLNRKRSKEYVEALKTAMELGIAEAKTKQTEGLNV